MDVEVGNRLACCGARVRDQSPALRHALTLSNTPGHRKQLAQHPCVARAQIVRRRNVNLGYQQHMYGSRRVDVTKGKNELPILHDVCRQEARNDPTKGAGAPQIDLLRRME